MFVATANTLNVPEPLLDRIEVIRLAGYTEDEKVHIARRFLVPKQMKNCGLKEEELTIEDSALIGIVRYYTREAGVRNLEREIAKICRKVAKELLAEDSDGSAVANEDTLDVYLGVRQFSYGSAENENRVGQVTGLAWTQVGGELLTIEAAVLSGKGKQICTGKLGEVMQESIQAAMTVVRSRSTIYGFDPDYFLKHDFHVHVPEGATPKDGPSAGIAMCTALLSAVSQVPVRSDVAMTGEITLRGEVLQIGGLKEKLLAAHRGGINTVLIPHENEKDLVEIPENVKGDLEIIPVRWIDDVLEVALERLPEQVEAEKASDKPPRKKSAASRKTVTKH